MNAFIIASAVIATGLLIVAGVLTARKGLSAVMIAAKKGKAGDALHSQGNDWIDRSKGLALRNESFAEAIPATVQVAGGFAIAGFGIAASVYLFSRLA